MNCFTSFHFSSISAGGKHSSHTVSSVSSISSTASTLLPTPFKLCDCIFPLLFLFHKFIAHPLHHSSSLSKTIIIIIINIMISNMNSPPSLKFFFYYLNYLLLLHHLPLTLSTSLYPPLSLLFVVAKLNGQPVADTAERRRLHLPVVDRVSKQADAVIERPLHPKSSRAEVIHAHLVDVVGMEVHHL